MKRTFTQKILQSPSYLIINIIISVIFMAVFLYSTIFTAGADNHPIDCYFAQHGLQCPTCGISRGFSEIMRGRISDALIYNQYSLRLFAFFSLQLILRIIFTLYYKKRKNNTIIIVDVIISSMSLIIAFYPIIKILLTNFMKVVTFCS